MGAHMAMLLRATGAGHGEATFRSRLHSDEPTDDETCEIHIECRLRMLYVTRCLYRSVADDDQSTGRNVCGVLTACTIVSARSSGRQSL